MFRILRESARDRDEVEALLDLAFAPGRTALSSYRLRDGVPTIAELSLVARDDYDAVGGSIRYWPVRVGEAGAPALLGPVAVHPTRQGEGLGALLITEPAPRRRSRLDPGDPRRRRARTTAASASPATRRAPSTIRRPPTPTACSPAPSSPAPSTG